MLRTLIVLCHPLADSLNSAAADEIEKRLNTIGASVNLIDLYREEFNPVLSAEELQRRFSFDSAVQRFERMVTESDLFVFIHPDWWGNMPALMKGWIERVLRPGIAYDYEGPEFGEKSRIPLLTGRRAVVAVTSDQIISEAGHPLEQIWKRHVLTFCGINTSEFHILSDVRHTTYRQRRRWMKQVADSCVHLVGSEQETQ